ncbi:porin family protein [Mangrovicoccus algicola]|uniref:Uncharacterized protein n=1 Tax=Mangrovicoccus algicola TaxID=2771008 RepID=A0A8J6YUU6_9RHOB|nr:hypothetical protein [Mangrovicoccus algicola]MBE3638047.1 hypothetical protein [Mangrovicoccus algicola]
MIDRFLIAGAMVGGAAMFPPPAAAQQDTRGGTILTARISSSAEADDNYSLSEKSPGEAYLWTNTLSFGMFSETRTDTFSGSASGDLRVADLPVTGTEGKLDNGEVSVDYQREIDDNRIWLNALANDVDLEFLDPLRYFDDDGSFDDTRGGGRRTLLTGRFGMELNGDGPARLSFSGHVYRNNYHDTTDDSLVDRDYQRLTALVGADVTETAEIYLQGEAYNSTRSNGNDSQSGELRIGTKADLSPITTLDANIGYQVVDLDYDDGAGDSRTEEGAVAALSLSRATPDGSVFLTAANSIYEGGQQTDVFLGREFIRPNGSFTGRAGISTTDASEVNPVFGLDYLRRGPTSQFRISANQSLTVDDDFNDRLNLALNTSYTQQINPVSSFTLSALAGRREDLEDEFDDQSVTRVTLSAQYDHAVSRDWSVSTGYRHRTRDEDDSGTASSNAVYLTLTRSFAARR